jgi:hypothetical protein
MTDTGEFRATSWDADLGAVAESAAFVRHLAIMRDSRAVHMCKHFLNGRCSLGSKDCRDRHEYDLKSLPACRFFAEGSCTRPNCTFRHDATADARSRSPYKRWRSDPVEEKTKPSVAAEVDPKRGEKKRAPRAKSRSLSRSRSPSPPRPRRRAARSSRSRSRSRSPAK